MVVDIEPVLAPGVPLGVAAVPEVSVPVPVAAPVLGVVLLSVVVEVVAVSVPVSVFLLQAVRPRLAAARSAPAATRAVREDPVCI